MEKNLLIILTIAAAAITFAGCKNAEEYFMEGNNAQENGSYELAIEYYQKAIVIDPDHADAYFNMGVAYNDLENYDEAAQCYKKAARLGLKDAQA